jgi:hypothetical protein
VSDDKLHDAHEAFEAEVNSKIQEAPMKVDSFTQSAWRGRVLAAISAAGAAWVSGTALLDHLRTGEVISPETLAHADAVLSTGEAAVVAVLGLVSLVAAAVSKWREYRKQP